jgi:hypothetical protein
MTMKKLISRLQKRMLKNPKHQLVIVKKEAESVAEAMGVDMFRFSMLEKICIVSHHESTSKVSCFQKIIAHCENTNEIVLMIYLFDKILENYYEQVRMAHLN